MAQTLKRWFVSHRRLLLHTAAAAALSYGLVLAAQQQHQLNQVLELENQAADKQRQLMSDMPPLVVLEHFAAEAKAKGWHRLPSREQLVNSLQTWQQEQGLDRISYQLTQQPQQIELVLSLSVPREQQWLALLQELDRQGWMRLERCRVERRERYEWGGLGLELECAVKYRALKLP